MTGIELLKNEHDVILKFTAHLRKMCCGILAGNEVDCDAFLACVEFGRNYADKHHHGKEERVLFRIMLEKMGQTAEKIIKNGMLVEHDLGRFHIMELERAIAEYRETQSIEIKLDIIANAAGYAALLKRHIEKENTVVFEFALRTFSERDRKILDDETALFEAEAEVRENPEKYLEWLASQPEY